MGINIEKSYGLKKYNEVNLGKNYNLEYNQ